MADPTEAQRPPQSDPAHQLWLLWRQGRPPDVRQFLLGAGPLTAAQVAAVLRTDQRERWQLGERVAAEVYLGEYPQLRADQEAALELVYGEFLLREECGEAPALEEYLQRFPQHGARLREQVELHQALAAGSSLGPDATAPALAEPSGPAPADTPPAPGVAAWPVVPGYEVLGELGRGGMGVVYKARQAGVNRVVALKMVLAGEHAGPEQRARFRAEAEAVGRMQHPHIVQIFQVGEHEGRPFFSMEYIDGGNLDQRLRGTPLPAPQAAKLVEALARAMDYAHGRGIVHRDLKPANVLLQTGNGEWGAGNANPPHLPIAKISDFGLVKRLDGDSGQTPSWAWLGTPSYMAPEQAGGKSQEVGPAADVHALGAILYECLTGRPPFKGATPLDTLLQVRSLEPVPPSRLQPKLPRELETICLKCLEKAPHRRYSSAGDLAEDLRRFLHVEPILARPPGALYRFSKFARRNKGPVAGAAVAFLALLIGIVCTSIGMTRALRAEKEAHQLLAQSYAQAAELAMRRGDWRAALQNFDKALRAGHPDSAGVHLHKVRAWCAVHEVAQAARELQALSQRPDLGELQGPALLWQADIALTRSGDDEKALEVVRQALDLRLPPAEEAYARGLRADTSAEAVRHFRQAVERDPLHQRANGMLALLLITLGYLPEARERVSVAGLLFPEDPTFHVLHALLSALGDDLPGAHVHLEKARAQLGDRQLASARGLVDLVHEVHRLDLARFGDPATPPLWKLTTAAALSAKALPMLRALRDDTITPGGLLLPIPPVLFKACGHTSTWMSRALLGAGAADVIRELSRAVRIHPEGLLYYALGLALVDKGRWAEAEVAFVAAAENPSFLRVRGPALHAAAATEWILGRDKAAPNPAMMARALENTRKLVALGGVSPLQASHLSQLALECGELDLARSILAEWERQAPTDLAAHRRRLAVELQAGAYRAALKSAKKILAQEPHDAEALRVLGIGLGEQLVRFLLRP
jgi:serine/threonine-protein kinase